MTMKNKKKAGTDKKMQDSIKGKIPEFGKWFKKSWL